MWRKSSGLKKILSKYKIIQFKKEVENVNSDGLLQSLNANAAYNFFINNCKLMQYS